MSVVRILDGVEREIVVRPTRHPNPPLWGQWTAETVDDLWFGSTPGDALAGLLQQLEHGDT